MSATFMVPGKDDRPYQVAYLPATGTICARGPSKITDALRTVPSASVVGDLREEGGYVNLPGTRTNAMIVEAVGTPVTVSQEYVAARREWMKVSPAIYWVTMNALMEHQPRPLLPHQEDFLATAWMKRSVINASEQGTGKTRVGWLMLQLWGARRALIVCPKSLVTSWQREWQETWEGEPPINCITVGDGGLPVRRERIVAHSGPELPPRAIVLNYEALVNLTETIKVYQPDVIICDESHRLKSRSAEVTKVMMTLARGVERVLLLTGTPIGNDIGDLWSQFRILGDDILPRNYWQFMHRYASLRPLRIGDHRIMQPDGVADPAGLMELIAPHWWRATKATCLRLPPKRRERVYLDLPRQTRKLYDAVKANGEVELGHSLSLGSDRVVIIRLQQIVGGHRPRCCETDLDGAAGGGSALQSPQAEGVLPRVPRWVYERLPCPKFDWLIEFTTDNLVGNRAARAIVWVRYNHEAERIREELGKLLGEDRVQIAWGATSTEELDRMKDSFNSRSDDGVQVIVAQVKKLAYGHNLQACDYNVYFSFTWSYIEHVQSEDRSHRHGREETVAYYYLIARNTVDEDIVAALDRKEDLATRFAPDTTEGKPVQERPLGI